MNQQQRILSAAMRYASLGWKMVPLYGVQAGGVCDCRKGADCGSAGKHPRLNDWGNNAVDNEEALAGWSELWPRFNVGLLLGGQSKIIDIEFDTTEGRATADALLEGVSTPSYRSSRSTHRLFRWRDDLPPKSIRKVFGLECRIGNESGSKAIQSVLPPSQHGSGAIYEWLPGLSPDEVEVAELPEHVYSLIILPDIDTQGSYADYLAIRNGGAPGGPSGQGRVILREGGVPEGGDSTSTGRNDALYRFVCREARRAHNLDSQQEIDDIYEKAYAINERQCRPPLPEVEVRTIVAGAIQFVRTTPTEREQQGIAMLSFWGLEYRDKEWWPGDWKLVERNSEPVSFRLKVPAWESMTRGHGVKLEAEEYLNAAKVARAVFASTREVVLEYTPQFWNRVWIGEGGKKPKIGLHYKLSQARYKEFEAVAPIERLSQEISEYVSQKIHLARQSDEPDPNGYPTRLPDGSVVFKWEILFQDAIMSRRFAQPDAKRWRDTIAVGEFKQLTVSGRRARYCIFSDNDVAKIGLTCKDPPLLGFRED